VDDVPDQEFGIASGGDFGSDVPEADRLEQLREATPGGASEAGVHDEPPVFDAAAANPADVMEQHFEVPTDDEDW
jgi:hypothetical protein